MTSLAIIPARGGSKRIKEKNIVDFYGKPLLAYSIDSAQRSNLFDLIHVSTDSEKIKLIADSYLASTDFIRKPSLADDNTDIVSVMRWVIGNFISRGQRFDDVCLIMPTAPLLLPNDLIMAYKKFLDQNRKLPVVAVTKYPVPVEWAYTIDTKSGNLNRTFAGKLTSIKSQKFEPNFYDSGAFAFFETRQLMEETYDIGSNLIGYELPRDRSVDIDTPEDLEFAKLLFKARL